MNRFAGISLALFCSIFFCGNSAFPQGQIQPAPIGLVPNPNNGGGGTSPSITPPQIATAPAAPVSETDAILRRLEQKLGLPSPPATNPSAPPATNPSAPPATNPNGAAENNGSQSSSNAILRLINNEQLMGRLVDVAVKNSRTAEAVATGIALVRELLNARSLQAGEIPFGETDLKAMANSPDSVILVLPELEEIKKLDAEKEKLKERIRLKIERAELQKQQQAQEAALNATKEGLKEKNANIKTLGGT